MKMTRLDVLWFEQRWLACRASAPTPALPDNEDSPCHQSHREDRKQGLQESPDDVQDDDQTKQAENCGPDAATQPVHLTYRRGFRRCSACSAMATKAERVRS